MKKMSKKFSERNWKRIDQLKCYTDDKDYLGAYFFFFFSFFYFIPLYVFSFVFLFFFSFLISSIVRLKSLLKTDIHTHVYTWEQYTALNNFFSDLHHHSRTVIVVFSEVTLEILIVAFRGNVKVSYCHEYDASYPIL